MSSDSNVSLGEAGALNQHHTDQNRRDEWASIWRDNVNEMVDSASSKQQQQQQHRGGAVASPNAGERLYKQAQKLQQNREIAQMQKDREQMESMKQFEPLQKSRELAGRRFSPTEDRPITNYGELLYQEAAIRSQQRRLMESRPIEEEEQYSFRPEISELARSLPSAEPVESRMEQAQYERERKMKQLKQDLQDRNSRDLTFRPEIKEYEFRRERPNNFLQNLDETEQRRQMKLASLRAEYQDKSRQEETHHPAISEYSKSLARSEPVHDRLFSLSKKRQTQLEAEAEAQKSFDQVTGQKLFHPQVNPTTPSQRPSSALGDNLYKDAEERRARKQVVEEKRINEEETARSSARVSDRSRKLAKQKFDKDLKQVFDQVDTGGTKTLNYMQLGEALRLLGFFRLPNKSDYQSELRYREEAVLHQRLWKLIDPDATGHVNFPTFSRFLHLVVDHNHTQTDSDSSPVQQLAAEFSRLNLNKLAYTPLKHVKSSDVIEAADKECSFTPKINSKSRTMDVRRDPDSSVSSSIEGVPRHESLYMQARVVENKREMERQQKQDDEMQDCTFHPRINPQRPRTGSSSSPTIKTKTPSPALERSDSDRFEALYRERPKRDNNIPSQATSLDREVAEHCTFQPDTSLTRFPRGSLPQHTPRGYKENIERMRIAQERREQDKQDAENMSRPKSAQKDVKPFKFLSEKRSERAPPLLYMDVNLGPGRTGRIGIHEGDDPRVLARNFAAAYQLDERLTARLEDLIRQHMESALPWYRNGSPTRS